MRPVSWSWVLLFYFHWNHALVCLFLFFRFIYFFYRTCPFPSSLISPVLDPLVNVPVYIVCVLPVSLLPCLGMPFLCCHPELSSVSTCLALVCFWFLLFINLYFVFSTLFSFLLLWFLFFWHILVVVVPLVVMILFVLLCVCVTLPSMIDQPGGLIQWFKWLKR